MLFNAALKTLHKHTYRNLPHLIDLDTCTIYILKSAASEASE